MLAVLGALLLALGLVVLTVAVYGTWRLDGVLPRMHAATKASSLGTVVILVASIGTGDLAVIGRAALVAALVVLTATISAHAIARAAHRQVQDLEEEDAR